MPDLSKICEKDDALFEVLQEIQMGDALNCFKKNDLPNIGQVVTTFVTKINFLKTAIFDLCESENLYATKIIFRSFIEHALKFNYVFMKWVEEKNDAVGENYLKWYEASENYDYLKSWEAVSKIANNGGEKANIEKIFFEIHTELKGKSIAEIKNIADQFKYRSIIKYLNGSVQNNSKSIEESFLLKLIPNYSKLSGYVHGGPTPDQELMTVYIDEETRNQELFEMAELSVLMAGSVSSWLLLMLISLDKSYEELFLKLRKAL